MRTHTHSLQLLQLCTSCIHACDELLLGRSVGDTLAQSVASDHDDTQLILSKLDAPEDGAPLDAVTVEANRRKAVADAERAIVEAETAKTTGQKQRLELVLLKLECKKKGMSDEEIEAVIGGAQP